MMATGTASWSEARREAARERREKMRELTPGERMERAYRLFALQRDDG